MPDDIVMKFVSLRRFQTAVWSIIRSLKKDYHSGFNCSTCGSFADCPVIVCDGTAVSFRAVHSLPSRIRPQPASLLTKRQGSTFADRVLISDPSLRKLLRDWACHPCFAANQLPPLQVRIWILLVSYACFVHVFGPGGTRRQITLYLLSGS